MSNKPVVFISYSHRNKRLRERIELAVKSTGLNVELWSDTKIKAGENWLDEITLAMKKASIAILILTTEFLASDFIQEKEIPTLLQRRKKEGMIIYPILAKSCAWDEHEWLKTMQIRPSYANPVWSTRDVDKKLTNIAKEIKALLTTKEYIKDGVPATKGISDLPFTNRNDEIENVLSSTAPAYHIFDAPAGYGKTKLLEMVEKRFQEKKWLTALISINRKKQKGDIVLELAHKLELNTINIKAGDVLEQKFGWLLFEKWKEQRNKGIVFLFDLQDVGTSLFEYIANKVVPTVEEILKDSSFFAKNHNAFRVIFAGRYLARNSIAFTSEIPFKITKLAPFNFDVILKTISNHEDFEDIKESALKKVAADLIYVTGGHPRCIAEIIALHAKQGGAIGRFVESNKEYIWNDIIYPTVVEIRSGVPSEFLTKLEQLSLVRRLDTEFLELVTKEYWDASVDIVNLVDSLLGTQLMDRNYSERVIEDGITRRLLSVYLRQELHENEFKERCNKLEQFCWQRISDHSLQGPEKWLIDSLFQHIQQYAPSLEKSNERAKRRAFFFSSVLPNALDKFVKIRGKKKWQDDKLALLEWLKDDWEFRYTLNYYFRGSHFSNHPFKKLKDSIQNYEVNILSTDQEIKRDDS